MNQRAYNPKTDSLMPRVKDHTRSAMASQQHQTSEFSVYDNNTSKFRHTGNNNMSFVKHPLRTSKVNRSSNGRDRSNNGMNNSLQKRQTGAEDPKDLVKELKQMKEQRLQTKKNQTPAPNQRLNDSNKKTVTLP